VSFRTARRGICGASPAVRLGLALAFALGCTEPAVPKRPNILLVMFDTLRRDHCTPYGYTYATTPTLQRIAARGVTFTSAYAPTSTTGPSTVSLFTSRYPLAHRYLKNGLTLGDGAVTLAELLQEAGYQTHAVVSSLVLAQRLGVLQGFDTVSDRWPAEHSSWERKPKQPEPSRFLSDRRAEYSVDEMLSWLRESRDPQRPFFAFLHLMDPHEPLDPSPTHLRRIQGDRRNLPRQQLLELRYDADVAYADEELGRLLDGLAAATRDEELAVFVVADHGQGLNDHGWIGHGLQLYEESVQIPFVAMYPGKIAPGTTVEGPVEILDVPPTILDYAGVDVAPGSLHGTNLRDAIEGAEVLRADRPVFLQRRQFESKVGPGGRTLSGEKFGVVWQGYKYIEAPGEGTFELYDLTTDPGEEHNLFEQRPAKAREMAATLATWRTRFAGRPPPDGAARVRPVTKSDAEALRALGYIE
jgi:choline-sulfatase